MIYCMAVLHLSIQVAWFYTLWGDYELFLMTQHRPGCSNLRLANAIEL